MRRSEYRRAKEPLYRRIKCTQCGFDQPAWQARLFEGKWFCAINCYTKWLHDRGRELKW